MARSNWKIPAQDEIIEIDVTGMSIIVEGIPFFSSRAQVPEISLQQKNDYKPMYPAAIWRNTVNNAEFGRAYIRGTTESEGVIVYLIDTPDRLIEDVGINQLQATLKATDSSQAASDAVQTFSEAFISNADGQLPSSAQIYVVGGATAGINYAFASNPSQGLAATDALYWDNDPGNTPRSHDPLQLSSLQEIQAFRYIATIALETPTLVVTFFYE